MTPALSVLLPCYNATDTLEETLLSLAGQTFPDFEVVAIDDGSTDTTLKILQAWEQRDRRFRAVNISHKGIITALNIGLGLCRAAYVARMDADDHALPRRFERQMAFLYEHPETAVVSCLVTGFPEKHMRQGARIYIDWLNSLISDEDIRREIFVESPLAHPSVIFRKRWVEQVGMYQENGWPEDYDLWQRLYLEGARFEKVPEVLLEWREYPQRLTRTDDRYSKENFLRLKAFYLCRGPLRGREAVILWGAGMMGRRLSKHLLRQEAPLVGFIDIDPHKIGHTRRGLPVLPPIELLTLWKRYSHPALLVAVGARGARALIRARLLEMGLREGEDFWCVA